MEYVVLAVLCILLLVPPALIVIGVIRRRKDNGLLIYMTGVLFTLGMIVRPISSIVQTILLKILFFLGITASFHDTTITDIPLVLLGSWLAYRLFRFISKREPKRHDTNRAQDGIEDQSEEPTYLMESVDGMLVRVPHSKLEAWEAEQRQRPYELTDAEKRLRDRIVADIYGHKSNIESPGDEP
ncbi:MAG: hypothetical protein IJW45_08435 [Oscillospiraceae bacterium]|nr:hypothetical protein [Oscillospiraceae bacterium]